MLRLRIQKHLDMFCQNIPLGPVIQPRIEKTFRFMPIYKIKRFQSCSQRSKFSLLSLDSIIKYACVCYFITGESVALFFVYLRNVGNLGVTNLFPHLWK